MHMTFTIAVGVRTIFLSMQAHALKPSKTDQNCLIEC